MVDFIGADKTSPNRWNRDEVHETMLPNLRAVRKAGIRGFVDCTPNYLGRDVRLLERLARSTGLHIVTNTGLYKEPYLPACAFEETADQLAERWVREFTDGIEGTGIKPGFIKIAVNPAPLAEAQRKIARAAALCSGRTGMAIACHTAQGLAALETLKIVLGEGVRADRWVFVHADAEPDRKLHCAIAEQGAWVEYDAVGWKPVDEHVGLISAMERDGLLDRLLVSHDAGWYHVGEPKGGEIKPYTPLLERLLPELERKSPHVEWRQRLLCANPIKAFGIVRG
jgi:phosphotriesterase-related protein